jgi:hypothetical protein
MYYLHTRRFAHAYFQQSIDVFETYREAHNEMKLFLEASWHERVQSMILLDDLHRILLTWHSGQWSQWRYTSSGTTTIQDPKRQQALDDDWSYHTESQVIGRLRLSIGGSATTP